jgi:fatty-acyl-CoA synthase/long-chain acyl-CoA synthetase
VLAACPGVAQVAASARCRTELGAYKRPKAFRVLDALPVTVFGKIDKKALRAGW